MAAHGIGLVHRDLKPANVLLEVTPGGVVPKVADFGLARLLFPGTSRAGEGQTRSNVLMGTPNYMAPEQIEDPASADARSDLFSLGAILYELVSGQRAFNGDKVADILYNVANLKVVPLSEVAPNAPERMVDANRGRDDLVRRGPRPVRRSDAGDVARHADSQAPILIMGAEPSTWHGRSSARIR